MIFYTYLWLREDGTPYYVGKGSGNRAFISAYHNVHKPADDARILVQDFPSEEDAFAAEIFLISYYGRLDLETGCLRNRTEGGDGVRGAIRTQSHNRKIAEALSGRRHSEQQNQKNREAAHRQFANPIARRKASEVSKKRFSSPDVRHHMSIAAKARYSRHPELRIKISDARKRQDPSTLSHPCHHGCQCGRHKRSTNHV
jgi:hypothetical protein